MSIAALKFKYTISFLLLEVSEILIIIIKSFWSSFLATSMYDDLHKMGENVFVLHSWGQIGRQTSMQFLAAIFGSHCV